MPHEEHSKTQGQQQTASDASEAADVEKAALNAVPVTAMEAEAGKDSLSQVSEASASAGAAAAEGTSTDAQTSEEAKASPSDSPKGD